MCRKKLKHLKLDFRNNMNKEELSFGKETAGISPFLNFSTASIQRLMLRMYATQHKQQNKKEKKRKKKSPDI